MLIVSFSGEHAKLLTWRLLTWLLLLLLLLGLQVSDHRPVAAAFLLEAHRQVKPAQSS
jgi:hypothetical protein